MYLIYFIRRHSCLVQLHLLLSLYRHFIMTCLVLGPVYLVYKTTVKLDWMSFHRLSVFAEGTKTLLDSRLLSKPYWCHCPMHAELHFRNCAVDGRQHLCMSTIYISVHVGYSDIPFAPHTRNLGITHSIAQHKHGQAWHKHLQVCFH